MEVIEIQEDQKEIWNNFIKENGTLLQSWEWGDFKSEFSWKPFRLAVVENNNWLLAASVLCKALPLSKSFLYIPEGPAFAKASAGKPALKLLLSKIKEIAERENAIFLKIEPFLPNSTIQQINNLTDLGFRKSFEDIQPDHRLWIDLTKSKEEILDEMKHKGRYNIKLAQRKGVIIKETNDPKMLDVFYSLYAQTGKRDRFSIRPKIYFQKLFDMFIKTGYAKLFIAFFKKQPLAAIVVTCFGKYTNYLYGASSLEHRELMASYLIQWEAIKKAKEKGCQIYDFGAIAPTEIRHPWSGLREFKMKFGGRQVDLPGCYDLVYKPLWYSLFKAIEKIRRKYV
jgi:lipid II:glycine glycyltransferase (peptidoglycan interpeptide bridge formation enzyme)